MFRYICTYVYMYLFPAMNTRKHVSQCAFGRMCVLLLAYYERVLLPCSCGRNVICSRLSAEALGIAFFNVHQTRTHCSQRTYSVMVSCKLCTAQRLWLGIVAL